jgi:hypothetical protein
MSASPYRSAAFAILVILFAACVEDIAPVHDHEDEATAGTAPAITEAECRAALDGAEVSYTYRGDVLETGEGGLTATVNAEVILRNVGPGVSVWYALDRANSRTLKTGCAAAVALVAAVREARARGVVITEISHLGSVWPRYIPPRTVMSSHSYGAAIDIHGIVVDGRDLLWPAQASSVELNTFYDAVLQSFELVLGPRNRPTDHANHLHAERALGASTTPGGGALRDGDLARSHTSPRVYYVLRGRRFPIDDGAMIEALGRAWSDVRFVGDETLAPLSLGLAIGGQGSLLKLPTSPAVWMIDGGRRRPFDGAWTEAAFQATTGQPFAAIFERATPALLSRYPEGAPIYPGGAPPPPPPPPPTGTERLCNRSFESTTDDVASWSDGCWSVYAFNASLGTCVRITGGAADGSAYARCAVHAVSTAWHLQLGQKQLAVANGMQCRLAITARASAPRSIRVVVQQDQGGISYAQASLALATGWSTTVVALPISAVPGGADPDARFTLWLADGGAGTVDFDGLSLTCN